MILILIDNKEHSAMPCHTDGPPSDEELAHWKTLFRHNSPEAETFCELMQYLDGLGVAPPPKAQQWWDEHKKRDQERVSAAKDAALAKLSPYERSLLKV